MAKIHELPDIEVARCKDGREWARLFIARNRDANVLDVSRVYGHAGLTSRLGPLSFRDIEELQAAAGAAGLTPELLAARRTERAARRAAREQRNERYLALSREELRALPDRECSRAVAVRMNQQPRDVLLPATVRQVRAAVHAHEDICNGGFDQFLWNTPPEEYEAALEGLQVIGAVEAATVFERALSLVRAKYPSGIRGALESWRDGDFDPLSSAYYAAFPRREPERSFEAHLAAFVRTNIGDF
jgi:hypothetical protein